MDQDWIKYVTSDQMWTQNIYSGISSYRDDTLTDLVTNMNGNLNLSETFNRKVKASPCKVSYRLVYFDSLYLS